MHRYTWCKVGIYLEKPTVQPLDKLLAEERKEVPAADAAVVGDFPGKKNAARIKSRCEELGFKVWG